MAVTLDLTGAPQSQANGTLTTSIGLNVEAGAVQPAGAVTSAFGMIVNAPTGATNNYAAEFVGPVGIGTATPVQAGNGLTIAPALVNAKTPSLLTVTGPADTADTASTEANDILFNLARTVQFATGALVTQRAMMIQAPAYGFVGASTVTTAATVDISGAPQSQTNATITTAVGLNVEAGAVQPAGAVTNAFGMIVNAPTGATNNYAAEFIGPVGVGTATPVQAGNGLTIAPALVNAKTPSLLTITGPADTADTASTEANDINFNLARTVQFATGALATQRAMLIQAPAIGFVGASTVTTAATVDISGAPQSQTNATITTSIGLNIEAGAVQPAGSVTTAIGLVANAPTGAT